MRFDMEVRFNSGVMTGDGVDPDDLLLIAELLVAKAAGRWAPIEVEGGHRKSTDDIQAIRIEANF